MRRVALISVAVALVAGSAALAGASPRRSDVNGNFTLAWAKAFDEFPVYYLGESFGGLPLSAIYRIDDRPFPGEAVRRDDVTFVYGSCVAERGSGCLPPLQVQSWSACERPRGLYPYAADEIFTMDGKPAAIYEEGRRLELAAGRTTVVLYASDPKELRSAAAALRPINEPGEETCKAPG